MVLLIHSNNNNATHSKLTLFKRNVFDMFSHLLFPNTCLAFIPAVNVMYDNDDEEDVDCSLTRGIVLLLHNKAAKDQRHNM